MPCLNAILKAQRRLLECLGSVGEVASPVGVRGDPLRVVDAVVENGVAAIDDRRTRRLQMRAHEIRVDDDRIDPQRGECALFRWRNRIGRRVPRTGPRAHAAIEQARAIAETRVVERKDDARRRRDPVVAVVDDDARIVGDPEILEPLAQIVGRRHLQHQTFAGVIGDRDVLQRDEPCAGDVLRVPARRSIYRERP